MKRRRKLNPISLIIKNSQVDTISGNYLTNLPFLILSFIYSFNLADCSCTDIQLRKQHLMVFFLVLWNAKDAIKLY